MVLGRLTGVPYLKEACHNELDRGRWGLVPVAQLANYKGLCICRPPTASSRAVRW